MAGAPLTLWVRQSSTENRRYYQTLFLDEPDAVEYVRKDVYDAGLEAEVKVLRAIAAALEALEDDDPPEAMAILRPCLSQL